MGKEDKSKLSNIRDCYEERKVITEIVVDVEVMKWSIDIVFCIVINYSVNLHNDEEVKRS